MRHGVQVRPDDDALCRAVAAFQANIGVAGEILLHREPVLAADGPKGFVGFLLPLPVGDADDAAALARAYTQQFIQKFTCHIDAGKCDSHGFLLAVSTRKWTKAMGQRFSGVEFR
ncbi:hypothetical protein D9M68_815340 [compost metagenome]